MVTNLNYAGNNFAISTGDVGEALMRSGSVLSEFGVSMQDAISMIVGANESVQDAEKVGTAIKTMATNLGGVKAAAKDGSLEMNRTAKALKTIAGTAGISAIQNLSFLMRTFQLIIVFTPFLLFL